MAKEQKRGFGDYLKLFQKGELNEIPSSLAFPLLHFITHDPRCSERCYKLNRIAKEIDAKSLLFIAYTVCPTGFIEGAFPKPKSEKDLQLDIILSYLRRRYFWSKSEALRLKGSVLALMSSKSFIHSLAQSAGMSDQERRSLKLEVPKVAAKPKSQSRSLFDY